MKDLPISAAYVAMWLSLGWMVSSIADCLQQGIK